MNFIGEQGDFIIVEFAGVLENKGKVSHEIKKFEFDVNALLLRDPVETTENGMVKFIFLISLSVDRLNQNITTTFL